MNEKKNEKIFFAVDCQKDFINRDGALYVKDAELIKPQLKILTDYATEKNIIVVNSADFHTDKSAEISKTPDFINTFPAHCMCGSEGCGFIEETSPKQFFKDNYYIVRYTDSEIEENRFKRSRNIIVLKDTFDVFVGNKLIGEVLRKQIVENIVVYGVVTSICVKFVVEGLLKRKFKVFLVIDAIKDLPEHATEALYRDWLNRGVILTTTERMKNG
jgi:nicotinamidase/pyrazinamidase